jgi:hypothetical protein
LEGWYCNKRPFVYFNYDTLYSRIPLNPVFENENPMPIKEKNRTIRRAADELLNTGYIQAYLVSKKRKGIYFIFESGLKDVDENNIRSSYFGLDNYNEIKNIIATLLKWGISEGDIDYYVKRGYENNNIEYVKALLRYCDMMMRYDNIKTTPKQFILGGLKEHYNIDEKYFNK